MPDFLSIKSFSYDGPLIFHVSSKTAYDVGCARAILVSVEVESAKLLLTLCVHDPTVSTAHAIKILILCGYGDDWPDTPHLIW